ncbi:MAG: EamA family transporter [Micromonosporaceae bacterium]|nr:EamA family transporter [Micromonosporaceae bacterium]
MPHGRATGVGLGLAVVSALTFATSGTFARSLIAAGWSAEAAVVARVGVAALILAAPAAWSLRGKWPVLRRNLRTVGIFGLLAVAGAQVGFFNAVRYLPIGVALLLEFFGIVLVVAWMWVVHRQRPSRLTMAGAVGAIAGLLFVLDLSGSAGFHPVGALWGLVAAVGLAGYFVLSGRSDPDLPPVVLATGGMGVGAVALMMCGLIGLLPLRATFGDVEFAGRVTSWLVPVAGLILVAAVVAYVAGIGAARMLGPRLASFVGLTEVVFAFLIAWLVVNEVPTPRQLVGGALIVLGVALVRLGEARAVDPQAQAAPAEPVLAADER